MKNIIQTIRDGWRYERRDMLLVLGFIALRLLACGVVIFASVKLWQSGDEPARYLVVGLWAYQLGTWGRSR